MSDNQFPSSVPYKVFSYQKIEVVCFEGGDISSEYCIFTLPGFPATKSKRNEDLSHFLAVQKKCPVFCVHYPGLGLSTGKFDFLDSVNISLSFIESILKTSPERKVSFVGHSWGGLIALTAALAHRDSLLKLVLLSPYLKFPDQEGVRKLIQLLNADYPDILENRIDFHSTSFEKVGKIFEKTAESICNRFSPSQMILLQAIDDGEVLPRESKRFVSRIEPAQVYVDVDTDHSFLRNRLECFDLIESYL